MSVHVSEAPGCDVGELYRALSNRLEQLVRIDVSASDSVVEDACQFAWDRLLHHRDRIRSETALPWLAKTAVREALKLLRRERRYISLDSSLATIGDAGFRDDRAARPEEVVLHRERIGLVGRLPKRQQQMVWLHALGLSYVEIAIHTGCTARTVERQLLRAKRTIRHAGGAAAA